VFGPQEFLFVTLAVVRRLAGGDRRRRVSLLYPFCFPAL
jgi:hypothetical protein